MKLILVTLLLVITASSSATTQSAYVGEETRKIKSLSLSEISGLLQGKGMGFAKAAELNHYPGPRHVLDLAQQLNLSELQITKTHQAFEKMRENAVQLGTTLIEYEKQLDDLFSTNNATVSAMDKLLLQIGETRAKLRGVHLNAHLVMKDILDDHQIKTYDKLRGYSNESGAHHPVQ